MFGLTLIVVDTTMPHRTIVIVLGHPITGFESVLYLSHDSIIIDQVFFGQSGRDPLYFSVDLYAFASIIF